MEPLEQDSSYCNGPRDGGGIAIVCHWRGGGGVTSGLVSPLLAPPTALLDFVGRHGKRVKCDFNLSLSGLLLKP